MLVKTDDEREHILISVSMAEAAILRDQLGDAPSRNAPKLMQLYKSLDSVLDVQPRDLRHGGRRPFEVIRGGKADSNESKSEGASETASEAASEDTSKGAE